MTIIEKLKLLFQVREPLGKLAGQVTELKRGYKKVAFWISFVGTLMSTVGALIGFVPPQLALIANTSLTAIYNILRGLDKAQEPGVRPLVQTTEFWQGVAGEFSNAIVQMQTGGVDSQYFHAAQTFIAAIMAASQNLGSRQPETK
jgi:hypothetical protein